MLKKRPSTSYFVNASSRIVNAYVWLIRNPVSSVEFVADKNRVFRGSKNREPWNPIR